jgi:hypothetical protein
MSKKSEVRLVYESLHDNKPVQVGNTYCSPACGCGCKLSQYRKAVRGAASLQKKLKGNWKGRVFEKIGWHFEANSGPLTVSGDYHGRNDTARYTCYLEGHLVMRAWYSDPREAVDKVLHHCSSSAVTSLTILELAFKAASQEDKFLVWLRQGCPALARLFLDIQSQELHVQSRELIAEMARQEKKIGSVAAEMNTSISKLLDKVANSPQFKLEKRRLSKGRS